ncbi:isoprenylcysteine carboxylmethyltransferase family protein [Limibaculum sp. M0105]|uniref:Isoprenylcysteine carboxylmethyltransferase family protein n=1 Tax=Thermohalobaculum xanthum TaxID=2753746 RepID=A0A8J7M9P9_9RHOB|nr:isoprenylcysteine carboxylmethyltransferase family protein [Thermohalobaculum xanthum]MBK0400748.1 isoprenylcysteine carboxylmethyltransferase family protein [Thermohalobaculum xanthum]
MTWLRHLDWPPVWLALAMAIASALGALGSPLGDWSRWPGWLVIAAGVALMIWAALEFRRARTTIVPRAEPAALVEGGPYRFSRNPIYIADLVILAGWVLTTGQPLGLLLLWPLARVFERRFILPEEAMLESRLGEGYRAYRARTRRWL